ncbi:MAG TPA: class I SAM-dependent methyltransferase [Allosphingosinicella sp.]|jgi:SAM-dependent methyltransferase
MATENYGIDAPTVVRNLAVIGIICVAASLASALLLAGGFVQPGPVLLILRNNGLVTGIICLVMAFWMVASSLWLKKRVMRALLDSRAWRGEESVLDIGCGRGLIAVAAARRVPDGRVTGIDLWQARDLAGNNPDAIRANGEIAGVSGRLQVDTGDARSLPYPEASFDVVASMTAIHNISNATGRAAAIAEAWRVTKPGGQILIFDIRHARNYAAQLRGLGAKVRLTGPILLWGPVGWRLSAIKPGGGSVEPDLTTP